MSDPDVVHAPEAIHDPLTERHPPVMLRPLANDEVAEPVILRSVASTPPPNVEVADPVTAILVVEKFVDVALVVVAFVAIKSVTPVSVAVVSVISVTKPELVK